LRIIYTFLFYALLPVIFLRLYWKGRRILGYRERWGERLGEVTQLGPMGSPVWIHAVSVGEVQGAIPLVQALNQDYPGVNLLVTTMTPTGSQRVKTLFAGKVMHSYLPYDIPFAIKRFLDKTQPRLLILLETELWPNLLYHCHQRAIPVILANARLSQPAVRKYQWVGSLMWEMLRHINEIAVQSVQDAEHFEQLGARVDQITVMGNLKFDVPLPEAVLEQALELRQAWGIQRPVWIASSTHKGEEELILQVHQQLRRELGDLLLILAPRHPNRSQEVSTLCQQYHFSVVRRTEELIASVPSNNVLLGNAAIYLVDTLGELMLFYACSDVAFVGGTLSPIGGHNLLEPTLLGLPILTGPHTFEWAALAEALQKVGIVQRVHTVEELTVVVKKQVLDPSLRVSIREQARQFMHNNQGSLDRLMGLLKPYLI